jgi:PAS domain S-box-containing protein
MIDPKQFSGFKNSLLFGFTAFLFVFIITQTIAYQRFQMLKNAEKQLVDERVLHLKGDLQNLFNQSYTATQTMSYIVQNYGVPDNFDSIAQLLINSNKKIDALELVNGQGVITHVYPSNGNNVLGSNILNDSISKAGANATIESKGYYTAGPIPLFKGGIGFVSRRPLFNEEGFTGFTTAIIRLSTVISALQLNDLRGTHFSYQLAKVSPDQSEEVFYSSKSISTENAVLVPITTNQGEWKLYVVSNPTSSYSIILLFSIFGLLLAIVCGVFTRFLARQPYTLNKMVVEKTKLLNERKNILNRLVEQASDGIFLTSATGVILEANSYGTKMLGYTKNELIGLNIKNVYDPEELKINPFKFKELKAGNTILHERTMIRKDGSSFYGEINAKMTPNEELLGIVRDITKRKENEQIAQNNLLKFNKAFNNSTIGMIIRDHNGCFVDANAYFLNLIGYTLEEVQGKNIQELGIMDIGASRKINPSLANFASLDKIIKMEVVFKTKTGKDIYLLASKETFDYVNEKFTMVTFIDQTEEKNARLKILDLQTKMDAAIRIGKIGYWDYDIETENANWSPRLYEIYNVKPGTTITIPLLENLIHPDDVDLHRKVLKETIVENGTHSYTYRIFDNNGSIKYLHIEMEADFNEEDLPVKLRGTVVDITEQKETENEIIDLKSKMDAAIRIGKIGYWGWDLENNLVEWSNEMFEIYGIPNKNNITIEEAIEFIHPDDSNVLAEVLSRKQDEDQTTPAVYKICLKDKTVKHILSFSENVYNNQGKPIKLHGTAIDITKSVLAEEALKENKEKFTKAFQTNLMGMIMLNSERRVIEANDVVYKLLEVNREGLIGKTIMESAIAVMENYDDNEREKFWKYFLKHGKVINQKFKINLKSGQKISLSVSIESLFFNDKEHYLVNLIDETKRKEAEEALELQNIQLKKTNSELDSFVYSASHELRAPLASVLGLINLILTEENKPGLVASLTMMEKSVRRLDDFIKDIIEYSRNKHLKVNVETINFTNLIESSIESFWYLENMNKIKVKINVDDKIDFASDKKRISILLNNFISNAIKYHDVSKRTPTIWISIKTSKKEAIIAIKDNGLGMAEEQLDKIFDMFYRISYQIMGSGIGLFIVKEVLGKLNGTIEVKSALGEGSTFTLKIPNGSDK